MEEGYKHRGRSRSPKPATSALPGSEFRNAHHHRFNLKDLQNSSGSLSRCNPTGCGNVSASSHRSQSPGNTSRHGPKYNPNSRRRHTSNDVKRAKGPPHQSRSTKDKPILHISGKKYAVRVSQGDQRRTDGCSRLETTYTDHNGKITTYLKWVKGEPSKLWTRKAGRVSGGARSIESDSGENGRRRVREHQPRSGATGRPHTRTSKSEVPSSDYTRRESQRYARHSRRPSVRHPPATTRRRSFEQLSHPQKYDRDSTRRHSSRSRHPRSKVPVPDSLWESLPHDTKRDTPHTRQATHRRSTRQPSGRSDPVSCTLCSVM
jgi:hypothetical protein